MVEILDGAYEVEFCDDEGRTYAELALEPGQLLVLHHQLRQMRDEGLLVTEGKGRGARWRKVEGAA